MGALIKSSCRELVPTDSGIQGRFAPTAHHELDRLVDAERQCCGWAAWSVALDGDESVFTATATDERGLETLHHLFDI